MRKTQHHQSENVAGGGVIATDEIPTSHSQTVINFDGNGNCGGIVCDESAAADTVSGAIKPRRPWRIREYARRRIARRLRLFKPKPAKPQIVILTIRGTVAVVSLNRGQRALIDAADIPLVSGKTWRTHRMRTTKTWYAVCTDTDGSGAMRVMHRVIMQATRGTLVDHWDGNGLNNTRKNLRLATPLQNSLNRHVHFGASRFRGVQYHKGCNKWQAQIRHYDKVYYLGVHATEEDAARAYDAKAFELHGDDACLNFRPAGSRGVA